MPKTGALLFFYDAEEQPWGYDPEDKGGAQVIYSKVPLSACALRAFPRDLDEELRFRGLSLTVSPQISLNYVIGELRPTEEEVQALQELLLDDEDCVYRMGGYADQLQATDPYLEAQLVSNGLYCGDGSGYREGKKLGLEEGSANWRLLLQVDTDSRTGMCWGDGDGRIFYMIRESDLRHRNFADVWLILQCT